MTEEPLEAGRALLWPSWSAAAIAYEMGVVRLTRIAVSSGEEPATVIAEAVALAQTTPLTFTQAADEVVRRMGRRPV